MDSSRDAPVYAEHHRPRECLYHRLCSKQTDGDRNVERRKRLRRYCLCVVDDARVVFVYHLL